MFLVGCGSEGFALTEVDGARRFALVRQPAHRPHVAVGHRQVTHHQAVRAWVALEQIDDALKRPRRCLHAPRHAVL